MSAFTIIRDGKGLNALITKCITAGNKYRELLHAAAVNALWHACEHGQTEPLNRLFMSLTSNDKQAFRMYVRKAHIVIGGADVRTLDKLPSEIITGHAEAGKVFNFEDKKWSIIANKSQPNAAEKKAAFAALAVETLGPTNADWPPFFKPNNFASIRVIGDENVIERIMSIAAELEKGDTDRKEVRVSDKLKRMVTVFAGQLESFGENVKEVETAAPEARKRSPRRKTAADVAAVH